MNNQLTEEIEKIVLLKRETTTWRCNKSRLVLKDHLSTLFTLFTSLHKGEEGTFLSCISKGITFFAPSAFMETIINEGK